MTSKLRLWELEQEVFYCAVCGCTVPNARAHCDQGHRGRILVASLRIANLVRREYLVELRAGRIRA